MITKNTIKNQFIMKCFNYYQPPEKSKKSLFSTSMPKILQFILIFILIFSGTAKLTAQVSVSLGNDIAICRGNSLPLADLHPVIVGANGNKWWLSSGDGSFTTNNTYAGAVKYNPGPIDLANGYFTITLYALHTNPDYSVVQFSDNATVYIQDDEPMACNDNVIFPLNLNCEFYVTPPMLLEGENENEPFNLYNITIYDEDGNQVSGNTLTGHFIGQTLNYTVTHQCSWNSCSGTITVRDNYHPITNCKTDTVTCKFDTEPETIGFPIDTSKFDIDTLFKTGVKKYKVLGWDACGTVELTYQDSVKSYQCGINNVFEKLIVRYWKAVDESNNISRCRDTIRVKRIGIDSIVFPHDFNNIDKPALECNGPWTQHVLPNGNPSPEYTGIPDVFSCSQFNYNYTDNKFPGCGNTFDVVREWTIVDWCTNSVRTHKQIIKIMDTKAPTIACITDTLTIGADPYDCNSQKFELPIPAISDGCSSVTIFVNVFDFNTNVEQTVKKVGNQFFIEHLPLKKYRVVISAIDQCNNISKCTYYIKAKDDKNPYVVCDLHTTVSLGSNGIARLYAESIDDGSTDNCGIAKMEIRKMVYGCDSAYLKFGPFVDFCCDEVKKTLNVVMKVTDINGNSNTCMTEVNVEDKLPPQITCPPDITISCNFFYDPNNLGKYFGNVVKNESDRKNIVINDYYNQGIVGKDGLAYDNCSVTVSSSVANSLNNCNVGSFTRTFTATDNGGKTNQCTQTITIKNPYPFNYSGQDIKWPRDTSFYGCSNLQADTSITGAPKVNDNMCSMVAIRYEDQVYAVQSGACSKIVRTWTVRDWCQSNDHVWTYEQYIMLINTKAPTFTSSCTNKEVCVYGDCQGLVELTASATDDCTPQEDLNWAWKVDINKDGVFDLFGQGNSFSKTLTEGTYTIAWTVEDKCGNKSVCTYDFKVKECKKPTPLCITDLTTVVMNNNGMVSIKAKAFNHGSYDNCTLSNYGPCGCLTDLKFSFSQNVNDTLHTFTCDSIHNGISQTFFLNMWVTDKAGNQDYCTVQLQVQDNNGVCPDLAGISVAGFLTKWSDQTPSKNVSINIKSVEGEINKNTSTDLDGRFSFNNLSSGNSYDVKINDNKNTCLSGVSTSDIVAIQKHILSIKKFDSPYKFIAADVNGSKSISASDISDIRKMILGTTSVLSSGICWTGVDASQTLTIANPYNYNSYVRLNNPNSQVTNANLKVIKLGDVNDNHDIATGGLVVRNTNAIVIDNIPMKSGKEYDIPVYIDQEQGFEGLQFSMQFNNRNIIFNGFEDGRIDPVESNFGYNFIDRGIITFSWNSFSTVNTKVDEPLFYLKFKALNDILTEGNIEINSAVTPSLAVMSNSDQALSFRFNNTNPEADKLVVYQNNPNPFTDKTMISLIMPENGSLELKIVDAAGKLLYTSTKDYTKGFNQIVLDRKDFSTKGILFYTLKSGKDIVTKKMILID